MSPTVRSVAAGLARSTGVVCALTLNLLVYERALIPLYGETATQLWMTRFFLGAVIIGACTPNVAKLSSRNGLLVLGVLFAAAPNVTYWMAALTARRKDALWGPIYTHLAGLVPTTYLVSTLLADSTGSHLAGNAAGQIAVLAHLVATNLARVLSPKFASLNTISDSSLYIVFAAIAFGLASLLPTSDETLVPATEATPQTATNKKAKKATASTPGNVSFPRPTIAYAQWMPTVLLLTLALFRTPLHSPALERPLKEPFNNTEHGLRILSSTQSITGLIVVGEGVPSDKPNPKDIPGLRYLRASHSLLGGVWVGDQVKLMDGASPNVDSFGTPIGDSIYSAFVLQEAVRFAETTIEHENALIIGLGAGIAATSFTKHGIPTTIVEIDPAVYVAARDYFGLAEFPAEQVILKDARTWVAESKRTQDIIESVLGERNGVHSLVVHDCFSGGGVPAHMFTVEFFSDLKSIMQPEGVLAVNFAGQLGSESSRAILHTLESTFGQCRAFHDSFEEMTEEKYSTDFINMVFFCSSSPKPLTFREPVQTDFLGSYLRRHVLSSLPDREVNLGQVRGNISSLTKEEQNSILLTDAHNPLGKWQQDHALEHWKLMREVMPDAMWETY